MPFHGIEGLAKVDKADVEWDVKLSRLFDYLSKN